MNQLIFFVDSRDGLRPKRGTAGSLTNQRGCAENRYFSPVSCGITTNEQTEITNIIGSLDAICVL